MYSYIGVHVHMCAGASGSQKRVLGFPRAAVLVLGICSLKHTIECVPTVH